VKIEFFPQNTMGYLQTFLKMPQGLELCALAILITVIPLRPRTT
jgi:hypothetical protein